MSTITADRQATDLFSLGNKFKARQSLSREMDDLARLLNSLGDVFTQTAVNGRTRSKTVYEYVGSDLATDLTVKVGQVVNSILLDSVSLFFRKQQPVRLELAGHNHDDNAHAAAGSGEFDGFGLELSTLIGANVGAFGAPQNKPFTNSEASARQVGLRLRYIAGHEDLQENDADHLTGTSFEGLVTARCEYLGEPSLDTTGWLLESYVVAEDDQEFDRRVMLACKTLTRTTA